MLCTGNTLLNPAFGLVINSVNISDPGGGPTTQAIAVLDTGADSTCISAGIASRLGLTPVGLQPLVSATGVQNVNVHIINLTLNFNGGAHMLPGLYVVELQIMPGYPEVLLGRDVICAGSGTLSVSNGGFDFCL